MSAGVSVRTLRATDPDWDALREQLETALGIHGHAQVDWSRLREETPAKPVSPRAWDRALDLLRAAEASGALGQTVWVIPFFGTDADYVAIELPSSTLAANAEAVADQDPIAVFSPETGWCFVWRHEEEMGAGLFGPNTEQDTS